MKFIKKLFGRETFKSLGTVIYSYHDGEQVTLKISCTFLFGDKGTKKVKLDYDEDYATKANSPTNHNFYHLYIVPWENSTGWADTDDESYLQTSVNLLCGYSSDYAQTGPIENRLPEDLKMSDNTKKRIEDKTDNIISVDFSNDK